MHGINAKFMQKPVKYKQLPHPSEDMSIDYSEYDSSQNYDFKP
jgi:hypothetical protein